MNPTPKNVRVYVSESENVMEQKCNHIKGGITHNAKLKFLFTPLKANIYLNLFMRFFLHNVMITVHPVHFVYSFTAELFRCLPKNSFSSFYFIFFITLVSTHRHFAQIYRKICECEWLVAYILLAYIQWKWKVCVCWRQERKSECICLTLSAVSFVKWDIKRQTRTCCKMNWTIKQL